MDKQKKTKRIQMIILALAVFVVVVLAIIGIKALLEKKGYTADSDETVETGAEAVPGEEGEGATTSDEEAQAAKEAIIAEADLLAAMYDYDAAIELLKAQEGFDADTQLQEKVSSYEATKATCVPVKLEEVTHIFYHSLVVDPERAFGNQENDPQAVGNNQWMTTISEFEKITQEMYDRGYVMVSIHDLYEVTTDENGNEVWKPGTIMLPPDKKAFVLSLDDLSYYHSYDNYGYAAKMILDEEGEPTCEYIQADGTKVVGAYDVVPLMDQFVEEHPDASYRGAKGIIALTGYNGILGYRTDITYITGDYLGHLEYKWLDEHPGFDMEALEAERAEAKKVADAMKENGWEFASHTWGHVRVGDRDLSVIKADTERWKENVEPLVGPVDTIIFAHGQDLDDWGDYDVNNEKFQYLKGQGYNIFCNVDSNQYQTWLGSNYLRQGRRNLDGYRIYFNAIGEQDNVSDLFDAAEILDPLRPPVHEL